MTTETTTLARDLITPEVATMLQAEAQAILDDNPDADANWKARVREVTAEIPGVKPDRAEEIAREEFPEDFKAYTLHHYCIKTVDLLARPLDPNMPKITLPHDIVTDEVVAAIDGELTKHEDKSKKPHRPELHPHHVQSRERLGKLVEAKQAAKARLVESAQPVGGEAIAAPAKLPKGVKK